MDDYFSQFVTSQILVRTGGKEDRGSLLICQKSCLNIREILSSPVSIREVHREEF